MMVRQQIEARGIKDPRVLKAMRKVERHLFVPSDQAAKAYGDYPLPIGWGQTISQPYIVAFMTEALEITPHSKVLEIGTGSGYQAAVLAELCDSVFTVEIIKGLGERASHLLTVMGYKNIRVRIGDGYQGWAQHAPYQAIIVTCSPTHIPLPLIEQLDEGGKMIIPVGVMYNQELVVLVKKNGKLTQRNVLPVRFVPMVNDDQQGY
jgi:protein-L-isoaspartate(D-aspartate) O-methyltransferase